MSTGQEVLVTVCGGDTAVASSLLTVWGQAVKQAKISNAIVAALSPECLQGAEKLGLPAFLAAVQVRSMCQETAARSMC